MKKRLPKTLFVLFVTLLCILIPAYDVMTAYSAMINNALNIQSYRVVESDIAADYDSEYFKADFSDPEAYAKAAAELCRQVEAEGLVLLTNQNGALPLPKQAKVSFFAQGAVYPGYGSTGSSAAKRMATVLCAQPLKRRASLLTKPCGTGTRRRLPVCA